MQPSTNLQRTGRHHRRPEGRGGRVVRKIAARSLICSLSKFQQYRTAPHHRLIAEHLERVERGEIDRLMLLLPPRHGKSELASNRSPHGIWAAIPRSSSFQSRPLPSSPSTSAATSATSSTRQRTAPSSAHNLPRTARPAANGTPVRAASTTPLAWTAASWAAAVTSSPSMTLTLDGRRPQRNHPQERLGFLPGHGLQPAAAGRAHRHHQPQNARG